ncbi:MAG: erythromycin esterase family protein, partial [Crocinitomicaceae bacterium]|nr:erythromycin esterase family protein [Crocinitomicaceae bacterium]
ILQEGIRMSNYKQDFSVEDTTYFCAKLRKIKQVINENHLQTHPYYLFWEQLCTNIISDYTRMYFQPFCAIRDSMMFENLKWYLSQHPEKKIILWAASGHLMYEQHNENSNNKPMGNYLKSYYKDNYYAIVYTAYSGKFGNSDRGLLSFKIKKSTKSSIEYNIQKIYHGNFALFSLRNQENKKFIEQNKITKAKIGRSEITMIPFEFADALFYIKEMHAPTYFFNK